MTDRSAVLTTLNDQVVEWKVFDDHKQAKDHYVEGVGKLREMIQHTSEDARWEIMLCEVGQYALSKPGGEARPAEVEEEVDWYSKYLTIMANQARRITGARARLNLHVWQRLRGGVASMLTEEDEDAEASQNGEDGRPSSGF